MKRFRRNILLATKLFILFLFIEYYCSMTLYFHLHFIYNQVIEHSHPYKRNPDNKSPFQSHSHTPDELSYIKYLNEARWVDTSVEPVIPKPVIFYFEQKEYSLPSCIFAFYHPVNLLRAPPFC
jgi:hypothetical protein